MDTVLIVDDDDTTRLRLKPIVEKEGFGVLLAADGAEALDIFEKDRPQIVLTDLKMPKVDGMELLHAVRRADPFAQVVVMTGHGDYDLAIHALRGGAIDYLRKPIDLDALFVALGRGRENLARYSERVPHYSVLIIEDDEVARERMKRIVEKEGYTVHTATDGETGVTVFEQNKIDVVLIDIRLPKKDGLQVLREIRQISEDAEAIVVTGHGEEQTAIQAMREGAANYLRKPIDIDQMLMAVQKCVDNLTLKRSILYRKRDVQLAEEVVAKITKNRELLIDVRAGARQAVIDFADSLLDAVPLHVLVMDRDLGVLFANRTGQNGSNLTGTTLDDPSLSALGVGALQLTRIKEVVERVYDASEPLVESIETSGQAFAVFSKLFVLTDGGTVKVTLGVFHGDTPQSSLRVSAERYKDLQ